MLLYSHRVIKNVQGGEIMTDTERLEKAILNSGLKKYVIADKLSIDRATLTRKIKNQTEFKAREISLLSEILDLSPADKDAIFYSCSKSQI